MTLYLNSIGLCALGLPNWATSRAVLISQQKYQQNELPQFDRVRLPRNEARRASLTVRLALQVATEAFDYAEMDATKCGAVFACSGGNTAALDAIFQALIQPERPVSPNQFNNSVHNAPLGYWHIATGSMQSATSVGAYDASFAAGLLEAFSLVQTEQQSVIFVAFDTPPPPVLQPFRSVSIPFSVALLLTPNPLSDHAFCLSEFKICNSVEDSMSDLQLERLRLSNSAARSLPLLQKFAMGSNEKVTLPYLSDKQLEFRVKSC